MLEYTGLGSILIRTFAYMLQFVLNLLMVFEAELFKFAINTLVKVSLFSLRTRSFEAQICAHKSQ